MTSRYRQILLEKKTPLWQRKEGKDPTGSLSVAGSKSAGVERPVTKKPSKLKKGSKPAKRRKSFCARMGGMKKKLTSKKTASDPDSRINKALRKWNCSTDVNPKGLSNMAENLRSLLPRTNVSQTAKDITKQLRGNRPERPKATDQGGGPTPQPARVLDSKVKRPTSVKASTDIVRGARLALAEAVISVHEISIGRLKDYLAAAEDREKKEGEGSVNARRSDFMGRAQRRIGRASEEGSQQKKDAGGEHGNTGSARNVAAAGGGANFQKGTKITPGKIPQGRLSPERDKALGDAADRTQGKPVKVDPYKRSSSTASLDVLDAGRGRTRNLPDEERRRRADAANLAIRQSSTSQRRAGGERALRDFRKKPVQDAGNSLGRPFRRRTS